MSEEKLSKREIILNAINEGGATMETLTVAADCKYESVMSNFSMLRLMGHCPVKDVPTDVEGEFTYRIVDRETYDALLADRKANAKTAGPAKSPREVFAAAQKRVTRCAKTLENAEKSAEGKKDKLTKLRLKKAKIESEIADFQFDAASANFNPEEADVPEVVEE